MAYWTLEERQVLEDKWARGEDAKQIALDMGKALSTIYRELQRGTDGTLDRYKRLRYDAQRGQQVFQEALRKRGCRHLILE